MNDVLEFEDDLDPVIQRFLEAIAETGVVWTLQDDGGFALCQRGTVVDGDSDVLSDADDDAKLVMPFWSDAAIAEASAVDDWSDYQVIGVYFDDWLEHWLPGLEEDGLLVGVDWTAGDLIGVDMPPLELQADLERVIASRQLH